MSEKRALEWVARYLREPGQAVAAAAAQSTQLNLAAMNLPEPETQDVLLCLDFGTAGSKAFARRLSSDELLPLEIGARAGQTEPVFGLVSSMYITADGILLFGHTAEQASRANRTDGRRRIESIKDILAKGDRRLGLGADLLSKEFNPTAVPLREIDMLTMYLSYFTDIATTELSEKHGVSRYVRRRFSLPVFATTHSQWATEHLRRLMAQAQVIADTFHAKWENGLPVTEVLAALDALRLLTPPQILVDPQGVTEPIAAISSRTHGFVEPIQRRELFAVVDVGAGTVDFALFCRAPASDSGSDGRERFWLVPETQRVLRQAGNQVDIELRRFMLEQAEIREDQSDFARIDASLSLDVRSFKEALFRGGGSEVYTLMNDKKVRIEREEFVHSRGMVELQSQIHGKFEEMLRAADTSWFTGSALTRLVALVTGGGADLPIVRSLDRKAFLIERPIEVQLGSPRPSYIEREYPLLSNEYPRLAVALGGCAERLPELPEKQFTRLGATQDVYRPEVVRKGS